MRADAIRRNCKFQTNNNFRSMLELIYRWRFFLQHGIEYQGNSKTSDLFKDLRTSSWSAIEALKTSAAGEVLSFCMILGLVLEAKNMHLFNVQETQQICWKLLCFVHKNKTFVTYDPYFRGRKQRFSSYCVNTHGSNHYTSYGTDQQKAARHSGFESPSKVLSSDCRNNSSNPQRLDFEATKCCYRSRLSEEGQHMVCEFRHDSQSSTPKSVGVSSWRNLWSHSRTILNFTNRLGGHTAHFVRSFDCTILHMHASCLCVLHMAMSRESIANIFCCPL